MEFDSTFCSSKTSPREKRTAKINGGGVESVDRFVKLQAKIVSGVKFSGLGD
jgi:hypothetical protein